MRTNYLKELNYSILFLVTVMVFWAYTGQKGRLGSDVGNSRTFPQDPSLQALIAFDALFQYFGTIIEGEKVVSNVTDHV